MTTNVVYVSKSGHTEKLAKAIAEECGCTALNLSEPHILDDPECLFIGAGVYSGKINQNLFDYISQLPANKIKCAAIFTSSVTKKDRTEYLINTLRSKGIEVFPEQFSCYGSLAFFKRNRPNAEDIEAVKAFARRVLDQIDDRTV